MRRNRKAEEKGHVLARDDSWVSEKLEAEG